LPQAALTEHVPIPCSIFWRSIKSNRLTGQPAEAISPGLPSGVWANPLARARPGEVPVQRLKAWLNAPVSERPSSQAICCSEMRRSSR
jgi:hypothetical protein